MRFFGPPDVDEMKARRDVKGLIKALGYQKECAVAAGALGQIGDTRAVEPLIAALEDSNYYKLKYSEWRVREAAVWALGQIGDARAVEPLIAALKDSDIDVRAAARKALELIGKTQAGWKPSPKGFWKPLGSCCAGAL